ncbi:MAG: hypothetical protein QW115_02565 [Thermoplasmata archaeon]
MTGRKVWKICLVLGIAALLLFPVAGAAPMQMPDTPGHSYPNNGGINWSQPENGNAIWEQRCKETRYFGKINYTDGGAKGRFVEFKFNESTGEITDYTVKVYSRDGTIETYRVFDFIKPDFGVSEVRIMGGIFMARGADGMIILHDNPAGVIHHIVWNASEIKYLVSSQFYPTNTYRNHTFSKVAWLLSTRTNLTGSVICGNGTMNITENIVSVSLSTGQSSFRLHTLHRYGHPRVEMQFGYGKLGAEISVSKREGVVLDDIATYREDLRAEIMEMSEERLRLRVEGDGDGTVVAVMVENRIQNMERIRVKMDGAEMKKATPEEVFGTANGEGKYAVMQDDAGNLLLYLYIPHFSTHEFEIFAASQDVNLLYIGIAFGIGLAVGVALAYVVFKRKKNSE